MLALQTPSGRVVGQKRWPLGGGRPAQVGSVQSDVLELLGGSRATYETMYRKQIWVRVCVDKLVKACARLPLKTYALSDGTGERTLERTSPTAKLLKKPFPRARTYKLVESIVGNWAIHGNATFVKFRGGNGQTPTELWPMPWRQVEVIAGTDRPIEAYRWTGNNGVRKTFLADDVVHFQTFNPSPTQPYGVSALESLAVTLALENAGQRYAISSFGNAARPASFIQSERNLTKEQRDELRAEIEASYGGPENAFKVALLDNGLDWKPLGHSSSESQLVDNRKLTREEVCAVYDIPPPMVGILDHATYSNIDQQHWMLYMDTLAPILKMIEDTLMAQLIDPEPAWDGTFVEFDMDAVLRGNFEQRSQSYVRQLQSGVATPNELRKLENREEVGDPAADAIYVPINLDPVSPAMRKLKEQEAQAQLEQQQAQAEADQAHQIALAAAGGTPKPPNGNGPPKDLRAERLMRDLLSKSEDEALKALKELRENGSVLA